MDIAIAVFSWILTILAPLVLLSAPVDMIIGLVKKDWKRSKEQGIYRKVQLACFGVVALCLMITIVLMMLPL